LRFSLAVFLALAACIVQHRAEALEQTGTIGDITFGVYAPDWTWQKRDINILVVLENGGAEAAEVGLGLVFPQGREDHFNYDGERRMSAVVPPGETVRLALTDILAVDGVPRQVYDFDVALSSGGRDVHVAYPVRTVRGAVVSPGRWALFLPGGLALAWCIVFALVVARFARPGAWRVPSAAVGEPEKAESWINQEPS